MILSGHLSGVHAFSTCSSQENHIGEYMYYMPSQMVEAKMHEVEIHRAVRVMAVQTKRHIFKEVRLPACLTNVYLSTLEWTCHVERERRTPQNQS